MRILIYEFLCAGGLAGQASADSLRAEGQAMLTAVLEDFTRVRGVQAVALVDPLSCLLDRDLPNEVVSDKEGAAFRPWAAWADYTLVIAPEFNGILETRCQEVAAVGGRLLGPSCEAVRLAGDKWAVGRHLRDQGIPTPPTRLLAPRTAAAGAGAVAAPVERAPTFPCVIKPRHGAGSQATFLVTHATELAAIREQARAEAATDDLLIQPFMAGLPASVALLLGPRQQLALPAVVQWLSADGRFRYQGGRLPLSADLADRAHRLARRAAAAVPGLLGYVGVDLVLGAAADGSQDCVIEINPRLTTSYIGLRALAQTNLAEAMLQLVQGRSVGVLRWRPGSVAFAADGKVTTVSHCHPALDQPQ